MAGNRLLLNESLTRRIERGEVDPLDWGVEDWKAARTRGEIGRLFPLATVPGQWWRRLGSRRSARENRCPWETTGLRWVERRTDAS